MKESRFPIAPEGIPFIVITLFMTVGIYYYFGVWLALLSFTLFLFCLWFFRDPQRIVPTFSSSTKDHCQTEPIISPADGKIVSIKEVEENRFLKQKMKRISIFMSPLNVHVNRAPVAGQVKEISYNPGKFFNASFEKASLDNEQNAIWMKTNGGINVLFVQIAGFIARRIVCYAKPGDHLSAGQRMGIIRFGSRVDVYLPLEAEIRVGMKQKVTAGETILASIPEK